MCKWTLIKKKKERYFKHEIIILMVKDQRIFPVWLHYVDMLMQCNFVALIPWIRWMVMLLDISTILLAIWYGLNGDMVISFASEFFSIICDLLLKIYLQKLMVGGMIFNKCVDPLRKPFSISSLYGRNLLPIQIASLYPCKEI